ncbi:MAG: protein MalT, partial [Desulfobacterales bacterium]|nr:protein MalT [Desulfobacterales bacterium]
MTPAGFHIPKVADVLPRPRLFRLLEKHAHCRVVLVTGQAAQGKSTLVADYLRNYDDRSLWFHLNRSASDHGRLFETLVKGIRQWGRLSDEFSFPPHITLGTREDLLRQVEILIQLLSQVKGPLNLILDDLESLDETGAPGSSDGHSTFDFIGRLIRESPDSVRFFLLSRVLPKINLSRLKMEKQVLSLTNSDLAFTLEEALAFFRPSGEEGGSPGGMGQGDIEKILDITGGWAGGLVLVSESIRQAHGLDQLPGRLTSEAFSWFSGEIYHTLEPEIRAFLMKTALFDELDTRVLTAFFDDMDPIAILSRLEKRNLFIQKINASTRWPVFKYNNLFRDFLKADLEETFGRDRVLALNKKAGEIFWDQNEHEKAIGYFMKARSHREIARIIRIKGPDYVITGRARRLAEWIEALPEEMAGEDPWLVFFSTMARRIKGGKKNIRAFGEALALFEQKGDTRGSLLCIAYLIEASVFIRQPSQVILKWIRAGEQALAALKGRHRFTWARTLLWQQIGLGYIAGNGDIPKGISACRNAVLLAQHIDNQDLILNASVILTLGFVQSGDFSGARDMLDKIRTMTREDRYPEYRALKNITNADLALKRGNLDLADQLLSKSEADIEKFGLIFLYPGVVEARALYYTQTGQFTQAEQTADHLSDFSILEGNDFYLGISHRIKAMCHLHQERYEAAAGAAKLAVNDLDRSRRGDIHLCLARQILGFSLFHLGRTAQAAAELEDTLAYFKGIGADLSFSETAIALGILSAGKAGDAGHFKAGFEKAIENQYRHFPLLEHRTLAEALVRACLARALPPADLVDYFSGFTNNDLLSAVQTAICKSLDRGAKKEQVKRAEQLRPLYKMARPRVEILTLGPFAVLINGRPLDPSVFGG